MVRGIDVFASFNKNQICENAVMEAKNAACDIQNSIIEQKQMLAKSAQQHQEVCDLADTAEIYGILSKVIDYDVKIDTVKSAESHTRKLRRVRHGLDLIRELFQTSCLQSTLFSTDLYALSNTGVEVMVSVSNEEVLRIGQSPTAASWINRNLAAFNLVRLASMFIVKRSDRYKQNVEHLLVVFFKRLKDSVTPPKMCRSGNMSGSVTS
ncbi:ACD11 homolog protein-like protein [Tanacetum coccineum]